LMKCFLKTWGLSTPDAKVNSGKATSIGHNPGLSTGDD
jgi:hypothetical protein